MRLINGLHFNNLQGDLYGGLTAAVVALPLALAMGVVSGAGPIAGLYGAILVGLFASIFGGTPAQVSGPTGPMTVVMALIFTEYTGMFPNDPALGVSLAFSVVIFGGLFQILFGLLRVGKYIELVPHPVVSGFMSGIGVIIIVIQVGPLLGFDSYAKPLEAIKAIADMIADPHTASLMLGLGVLVVVYGVPKFLPALNRVLPSPLLALVLGTVVSVIFLKETGIKVLGEIPSGLPDPVLPRMTWDLMPDMLASALILAALGSIDSLLTSLVADNVTRNYHKSNRELIGQGIGNTVAGLFGGLPGAGATMRTVVNIKAGGQTPVSGVFHALVLLAIVLGAGGLASEIPKAVLAGILVKVGTDIIDWDYLKRMHYAPKAGVVLMLVVFGMTVFIDLFMAVATGMVMASLLFLKRVTDLQLDSMTVTDTPEPDLDLSEEEKQEFLATKNRAVVFHIGGEVSFGAAKGMMKKLSAFNDYDVLILDMTEVPVIDFTACRTLDSMIEDAIAMGREVMMVGVRSKLGNILKKQKVMDRVHSDYRFVKLVGALREAQKFIEQKSQTDSL